MRILLLCTAHNSLSQRLFLALKSRKHSLTVEYALSEETMMEAADMAKPHLIICPFLTTRVPQVVYENYMTLIVHPGPPGDAGPSALDWLLMGDDGTEPDSDKLLRHDSFSAVGRSHWAVTVLQAIGEFDAGPVWAFDQFPVDINEPSVTKSSLYRGAVTQAAITATLASIDRIDAAATVTAMALGQPLSPPCSPGGHGYSSTAADTRRLDANLVAHESFAKRCVSSSQPFRGGQTHHRPLLKASQRDFDPKRHSAAEVSRRIRSSDSQPGCLSTIFGPKLYLYGGIVEDGTPAHDISPGSIIASRDEAVCIATGDGKGVWITHVRRVKTKADASLWPKVPAVSGLVELGWPVEPSLLPPLPPSPSPSDWARAAHGTFQEVCVDFVADGAKRLAYLHFDFYNGAMSTAQCRRLVEALKYILSAGEQPHQDGPLAALVLMGGQSYFSNGIHLNVIEAAADPALESWYNINAINDIVACLLSKFPPRGITTVAAVRGNCAAGGVALATACDVVLAGERVVLNPAYRALGLYGSEFHSLSYPGRCGAAGATAALRSMTPLSAHDACRMGLVDHVLAGSGPALDAAVRGHVQALTSRGSEPRALAKWKQHLDLSPAALAQARAAELSQMAMDFWSPRSVRYHSRRSEFVRKTKATATPLRFAAHRRAKGMLDEEEDDRFDSVEWFAQKSHHKVKQDISAKMMHLINDFSQAGFDMPAAPAHKTKSGDQRGAMGVQRVGERGPVFSCYYAS